MKDEKIIEAIRPRHRRDRQFQISRTIPKFFSGELVVIDVLRDEQTVGENYAYINAGQVEATFLSMDDLAVWVSARSSAAGFQNVTAISGFIAVVITLTICAVILVPYIRGVPAEVRVPDILSNALTVILGFYFGSQVARSKREPEEKPKRSQAAPAIEPE